MKADKRYIRDGRAPVPLDDHTSRMMSSIRAKATLPELTLRAALRSSGLVGYRLNWTKAPGRPDIAFPGRRKAIFVHGCFWHRCPVCKLPLPRSHTEFWREKFRRNQVRDRRKVKALRDQGWDVLILWECEIRSNIERCLEAVKGLVS